MPVRPPRPDRPRLVPATVDLWRLDLARIAPDVDVLSRHELARAAAVRHRPSRWRFTTTRTAVRRILARYLDVAARDVPIVQRCPSCGGPHGRPGLASDRPLRFSVAHSGRLACLAICRDHPVGVDLESGDVGRSPAHVERRLAAEERLALRATDDHARRIAFLRIWTRKEAYLKATGEGLGRPLSSFAVSAGEQPRLLWAEGDDVGRWRLADVPLPGPAVGAVALRTGCELRVLDYVPARHERGRP